MIKTLIIVYLLGGTKTKLKSIIEQVTQSSHVLSVTQVYKQTYSIELLVTLFFFILVSETSRSIMLYFCPKLLSKKWFSFLIVGVYSSSSYKGTIMYNIIGLCQFVPYSFSYCGEVLWNSLLLELSRVNRLTLN